MEKLIVEKNQAIIEKIKKRFSNLEKENLTMPEIRNELILRIQKKTGKTEETILREINSYIEK